MNTIDFLKNNFKKKRELKKRFKQKSKRESKGDEWEIDEESDYPIHEKYTKEEPVKK